MSALRQTYNGRQENMKVPSTKDMLKDLLKSEETMYFKGGFWFMQHFGAPMPTALAKALISEGDISLAALIN